MRTLPARLLLLAAALVLVVSQSAGAKKRPTPTLNDDAALPADFLLDYQLGLSGRGAVRGSSPLLQGTAFNEVGNNVFRQLLDNSQVSGLGLPYQWNFTIIDNNAINAHSLPDGEISVDSGLAKLIGTSSGLWAAILSHETIHTARRHAVRQYLYRLYIAQQVAYYQARVRAGDNSANWALLGLRIAAPIAALKLSRSLEHEADVQGMMLMARAGYHPDYVFALHHLMRTATGEQSKFAAFFSTHPRWETRDQRADRAYTDAVAEYSRMWPDAEQSPGGAPPLVAFVEKPLAQENKKQKTADINLPVYCRNATEPLEVVISFRNNGQAILTEQENYRNQGGELEFTESFSCQEKEDSPNLVIHLPATLVPPRSDRKLQATLSVYTMEGSLIEKLKPFDVHFPKP